MLAASDRLEGCAPLVGHCVAPAASLAQRFATPPYARRAGREARGPSLRPLRALQAPPLTRRGRERGAREGACTSRAVEGRVDATVCFQGHFAMFSKL